MSWLAWLSCALGAWAAIAPFVFPWDVCGLVYVASVIPGALVFLLSGGYALSPKKSLWWLCGLSAILGLWLIISPFVAGYALVGDLIWSNFLPGALITILSAVAAYQAFKGE